VDNSAPKDSASHAGDLMLKAARVLSAHGHDDFNQGQISVRDQQSDRNRILIGRASTSFHSMRSSDIISVRVDAPAVPISCPAEFCMHAALYKSRSDVNSIVHTHSLALVAFGATDLPLESYSHEGAIFSGKIPRFIETSQTVTSTEQAERVAAALGDSDVVLLRNHGVVVVGSSIKAAVVRLIILERAVRINLAMRLLDTSMGKSSDEDDEAKRRFNFDEFAIESYWRSLVRDVSSNVVS